MILFLDFDGVLHPTSDGELFSSLPLLEAVLCDVSHVRVVISSSWRELPGLQELRGFFCEDLRGRIIGTTPLYGSAELIPKGRAKYRRHAECLLARGVGRQALACARRPGVPLPSRMS